MNTLTLTRFNYGPDGTFGTLRLPDGTDFYTVELPWQQNKRRVSCIPDGVYKLGLRQSPVVQRTSGLRFTQGYEIMGVPNRTYIMIHPGNWPHNFAGCIGVGLEYAILDGKNAVTSSRVAFAELMGLLGEELEWHLDIRPFLMEYP